jgi:hypothetical protein
MKTTKPAALYDAVDGIKPVLGIRAVLREKYEAVIKQPATPVSPSAPSLSLRRTKGKGAEEGFKSSPDLEALANRQHATSPFMSVLDKANKAGPGKENRRLEF